MFEMSDMETRVNGAKIKVIGVGGGGCNAVNTMIRSGLSGVEYIVANTDSQALAVSLAETRIQLGNAITKGLGAGANPEVGKKAALEDYEKLSEVIKDADMVFITAGMGGGTGTGAAPVIAKLAKELGALTVGVVTKPFVFEGKKRFRQAEEGIKNLEDSVDSLITIPNQRLLYLAGENLSLVDTFKKADEVLLNAVRGISDLINNTGHINADFADVSTVMANKGLALMGTGTANGPGRAIKAATEAISSPLLEDISINGATGIIINITGSDTLSMHETNEAVTLIMEAADEDAEIIFGTVIDNNVGDDIKITVIATGLSEEIAAQRGAAMARPQTTLTTAAELRQSAPAMSQTVVQSAPVMQSAPVQTVVAQPVVQQQPVAPVMTQTQTMQTSAPVSTQSEEFSFGESTVNSGSTSSSSSTGSMGSTQTESQDYSFESSSRATDGRVESREERSDFERFMNDRNSYQGGSEEVSTQNQQSQSSAGGAAPSRLIQQIREAANRYEATGNRVSNPITSNDSSANRAKSIAEKLGFINFDEDEFDTPSYLRKDEGETKPTSNRDMNKNYDL